MHEFHRSAIRQRQTFRLYFREKIIKKYQEGKDYEEDNNPGEKKEKNRTRIQFLSRRREKQ